MNDKISSLKLLYEQLYEISIEIGQLIDRQNYDQLDAYLVVKDNLIAQISILFKEINPEQANLSSLEAVCEKINAQEQANINALTMTKDSIKKELNKANKKTKVANAYNNVETKQGNLLDYRQ